MNQSSQQMDKQLIIEKLALDYQTWFYKTRVNEETKSQQVWLERKKKGILQSSNINFTCSISQQKVQFPVVFTFCVDQKTNDLPHFDEYCDLTCLIDFITNESGQLKTLINCPICKKKKEITPNKLKELEILQQIIRPHLFILNLRKQVGILPKEIMYNYKQDKIFPIYKGKYQQYWNSIEPIFEVEMKKEAQFFEIADKLQDYQGSEFTNICLLSQIRVNIPVRGTKCVHYEAYDLAALYKFLSEKADQQKMKCVLNYCESVFDLKDLNCFCIDFDLLKAGMEGLSFSMNFCYIPNFRILSESLLNKQRDEQILFYRQIPDNEKSFLYLHKIYEMSETIFANESNKSNTEKFYQNFASSNLPPSYNLFQCEITRLGIQIPARCKNCTDLKICDLRFFACILHQVKNKEDLDGVFEPRMECPLCKSKFVEKPKPPQTFFSQVYIDTEMMKFFLQTPFYCRTIERFLKFTKQKPAQLQDIKIQKYKEKLLNLEERQCEFTSGVSMYKITLYCILSGNKLKIPVRHKKCNHYDCFDRDSLIVWLERIPDLEDYKCPFCNQVFGSVDNLYIDQDLNQIMQKQAALMTTWHKGVVNTFSKMIQQI